MKNIFIFGSNGMLGRYINLYLSLTNKYKIITLDRTKYDVIKDNSNKLKEILTPNSIVINCIGIIPQTNRNNTKEYLKVNSIFPNMLSVLCNELNIKIIHITTDCVFSGKKGNYTELDEHDETNMYGISKSLGEPENCTVIRTSIIGEELKSNKSLLEWVRSNKNKEINGYSNHYWNGVTCLQLAKIIEEIITKDLYWIGVKHIFSPNNLSKYELSNLINVIYNLNIKINKHNTENNINKTLSSIHNNIFNIPELKYQIQELFQFKLV